MNRRKYVSLYFQVAKKKDALMPIISTEKEKGREIEREREIV